jgi:hypothetical protein
LESDNLEKINWYKYTIPIETGAKIIKIEEIDNIKTYLENNGVKMIKFK